MRFVWMVHEGCQDAEVPETSVHQHQLAGWRLRDEEPTDQDPTDETQSPQDPVDLEQDDDTPTRRGRRHTKEEQD